jgi:hypothetical protein
MQIDDILKVINDSKFGVDNFFFQTFFSLIKCAHFLFKIGEDPNIDDLGFACCTLLVKMKR